MFFNRLRRMLWEHAIVCRAVTVDEYREGIVNRDYIEKEFENLWRHWNRATRKVDMHSMAYPVDLFIFVESNFGSVVRRSGWEFIEPHPARALNAKLFSN